MQERNTYYPSGLQIDALSSTAAGTSDYTAGWANGQRIPAFAAYAGQLHGRRYLDPAILSWYAVEPLATKFAGVSTYSYALGDPVNLRDVTGFSASSAQDLTTYQLLMDIFNASPGNTHWTNPVIVTENGKVAAIDWDFTQLGGLVKKETDKGFAYGVAVSEDGKTTHVFANYALSSRGNVNLGSANNQQRFASAVSSAANALLSGEASNGNMLVTHISIMTDFSCEDAKAFARIIIVEAGSIRGPGGKEALGEGRMFEDVLIDNRVYQELAQENSVYENMGRVGDSWSSQLWISVHEIAHNMGRSGHYSGFNIDNRSSFPLMSESAKSRSIADIPLFLPEDRDRIIIAFQRFKFR